MSHNIEKELDECSELQSFRVPVTDNRTGKDTFLLFNVSVLGGKLVALAEGDDISVTVSIDTAFDLQAHLEWMFSDVQIEIICSDYFTLR